ncbi:hypothetical protein [Pseudomonas veronii]|uniref:hypothetical protein n=1 Tax=Pseudomonas veronii TaxID=76761 RepID=UPI000698A7BE|nr:hypothetical protein [Pseudomonas veronii]
MADCGKDRAPIQGLGIRWGFSRYEAQKMSGPIQSSNYVPGVSGWKLDHVSGDFEINSAQIQVGTLPSDPQLITVTAGSWSEYDLPANALERLAFIGAELEKIPAGCRASAEFTTEDISFDRDGSDVRTSLTYERHETAEEVAARQARAKVAGTRITQKGGLTTISIDGVTRFRCGDLTKAEQPQPFVVADDQVFIDRAFVVAGIGPGLPSQYLVSADRFAINDRSASDILEMVSGNISRTDMADHMKSLILESQVKEVIRAELKPGGLLHRSR